MSFVADTGGLFALYDADDKHHQAVVEVVSAEPGALVVPTVILGEIGYLLAEHLGREAEWSFLDTLCQGYFVMEHPAKEDLRRAGELLRQYADLRLGLVDACVIATCERLHVTRVLTLDQRHFRSVRARGIELTLLPFDA